MANIPNTTQTPNIIFNGLMREMTDTELRVVLIVTRATLGWILDKEKGMRKTEDWISHSQLKQKTGRESGAISKAIDSCIQKQWIEARDKDGTILDTKIKRRGKNIFYRLGPAILLKTSSESEEVYVTSSKSEVQEPKFGNQKLQKKFDTKEIINKSRVATTLTFSELELSGFFDDLELLILKVFYELGFRCHVGEEQTLSGWCEEISSEFADIDFREEIKKFSEYWEVQSRKLKTHKLAWRNWLTNARRYANNKINS